MIAETLAASVRTPVKSNELLVAPSHVAGDFFSHGVDCPFVFTLDGRTGMTVVGWDGIGYQTGLCWLEDDGWTSPELIFGRDAASDHRRYNTAMTGLLRDSALDGTGELIAIDGWYYGTYHAYPSPGYEEGPAVIGIARSRDLRTWEEFGELIRPEDGGDWERGGLYKSWLMRDDDGFRLFYNAKDRTDGAWVEQTGAVVSDDMVTWKRVSDRPLLVRGGAGAFDERFASDPCVLRAADGTWVMFYFGLSHDGHARDSYAVSADLVNWQKSGEILVDIGPRGSVDDRHAHKPAVIRRGDMLEHYYCAVRATEPFEVGGTPLDEMRGISVARSR